MIDKTQKYTLENKSVWIAGHNGMVGSALLRRLAGTDCRLLTASRDELDLTNQAAVLDWLKRKQPDVIIIAAAKVGGIQANQNLPADFIYSNLMIQNNIIDGAHRTGFEKLLFLGSSCIYPRNAPQPIVEDALLSGPLEETNQWYALAKIAGIKLGQAYREQYGDDIISVMPTNLYGPGDNFHPENSHVPAALIRRFHESKIAGKPKVTVWGTGKPQREFLHVDDLADACIHLLEHYSDLQHINVGTGCDITIRDFASKIKSIVGYEGEIVFDTKRADGTPRKVLNVSRLHQLGWKAKISLSEGLENYYRWFLDNIDTIRQ